MITRRLIMMVILTWFLPFVASCTLFAPQDRISPEGELPEKFSLYEPGGGPPGRWWREFNDPELDALVNQSLLTNFSLQEAWARVRQASSATRIAGAKKFPDLTMTAGSGRNRQRTENDLGMITYQTFSEYSAALVSGYELDLWGKIRSEKEATELQEIASREDLNTAAMTLTASVVEKWINIISQRKQKRLLEKQYEVNQTLLELIELRFRKGIVTALDVYQQKQVLEEIRAAIPQAEELEILFLHDLAYLIGKFPKSKIQISREDLPVPVEIPAIGIPAGLLASRPDIRAAGLRLKAADWQVSAARADRLPAIRLTGTARASANEFDLLFDNWLGNLAANLTAPIFDGFRRAAEVERARARSDENLWKYRDTVLRSIKEVEDILVSEVKQRERIQAVQLQINAARNALDRATENYIKGVDDYLPVLTQLLTVQRLERSLIVQKTSLVINRISLYRSLGGTWTDELSADKGLPDDS